jgi:enoyl-CoA hydratase
MAAELALTGDVVDAQRALEIGLVNRVVPPDELMDAAIALAANIASKPWRAVEATKQALRSSWHVDLSSAFNAAFWATAALHYTDDFKEGVDAFVEKREPAFGASDSML